MNKQSNVYTIIYIIVLVVVVGAGLALTAMALKPRQMENANADKMKQILAAVHITPAKGQVSEDFSKYITRQLVVNIQGQEVAGVNAFDVNIEKESKTEADKRLLPVYECTLTDSLGHSQVKYILPVYGAGLWGPIWGYLAVDSDGDTVYGAFFAHQGETPGLGAEIEKPAFCNQFGPSLHLFTAGGRLAPIEVIKQGQKPFDPEAAYVDGISGGTITSKGVGAMIENCIAPYAAFLSSLSKNK